MEQYSVEPKSQEFALSTTHELSQHAQSSQPTQEVAVIVHAGQTATSEESQLGIITDSKRRLIAHELETANKQTALACSSTTVQANTATVEEG